jgi:hypothetical protein
LTFPPFNPWATRRHDNLFSMTKGGMPDWGKRTEQFERIKRRRRWFRLIEFKKRAPDLLRLTSHQLSFLSSFLLIFWSPLFFSYIPAFVTRQCLTVRSSRSIGRYNYVRAAHSPSQ